MNIVLPDELVAQLQRLSEHHLIKALDQLILFACEHRASDLHFDPISEGLNIRLRIDGVLQFLVFIPLRFAPQVLSGLKMLAQLDIAEKRLPQDGRFCLNLNARAVTGRISICPTILGEKAVIHLLPNNAHFIPLSEQGMSAQQLHAVSRLIEAPHGLVIVTGPTGSGKTMTLYALLRALNNGERNLISVEDPVEMILPQINQIQVQEKAGLEFKSILRSLLRQDPDVLMIGEIRDAETAEIAIKAAQTGHLVLSTLHTASSVQAFSRLEQLGLPRYLIQGSTKLILAQRLVRKITSSGFYGRTGIFEVLELSHEVQKKLMSN